MTRKYYAIGNSYASATSRGFLNTEYVRIFDSRADRDYWVAWDEQSVRACTKKEAIDAVVGNYTCGETCTREDAWRFILEDQVFREMAALSFSRLGDAAPYETFAAVPDGAR